jgi:hypothetical protein
MINEETELEDEPTPAEAVTDVDSDTDETPGSDDAPDGESETPANKWSARPSLSELMEEDATSSKQSRTQAERDAGDEDDEDDDSDEDEESDAAPGDDDADAEGDEEGDENEESDEGESSETRYTIQDAEGNRFEFQLDEGTSVTFEADGKTVSLTSMDDVIALAQKGVAFDRRSSEWGQTESTLKAQLEEKETTLLTERQQAEELLLKALFDRTARDELRKALAPFRDPEFRKGQEAIAREAERVEREKTSQTESVEENQKQFWTTVGTHIKGALADFDLLEETDARAIAERFYHGYTEEFNAALAQAERSGLKGAAAEKDAQKRAFAYLTDKNVRRAMRSLNEDMKARLVKRGIAVPKKADKKPSKADAEKAAGKHNAHVKQKLEQRKTSPKRLEKGADPAAGMRLTNEQKKPQTFTQKMDAAKALLRSAGKTKGERDDDE